MNRVILGRNCRRREPAEGSPPTGRSGCLVRRAPGGMVDVQDGPASPGSPSTRLGACAPHRLRMTVTWASGWTAFTGFPQMAGEDGFWNADDCSDVVPAEFDTWSSCERSCWFAGLVCGFRRASKLWCRDKLCSSCLNQTFRRVAVVLTHSSLPQYHASKAKAAFGAG